MICLIFFKYFLIRTNLNTQVKKFKTTAMKLFVINFYSFFVILLSNIYATGKLI